MTDDELLEELDLNGDGKLSREEVHDAARLFGWHWREAPLFALLDFLTIRTPLDRDAFVSCMEQVAGDPHGVYGDVLLRGPRGAESTHSRDPNAERGTTPLSIDVPFRDGTGRDALAGLLKDVAGERAADDFAHAVARLDLPVHRVLSDRTALLLIDPQRSFTAGEWMRSMGPSGERESMPIRLAFVTCARLLEAVYHHVEVMFTRCPFPPESYGWDERLEGILDAGQIYVIKPGNNVLMPPTNGFREWMDALIGNGITTLVMGGCTLNSCVRVSACAVRDAFPLEELEIVVDLSLCGARAGNYLNSPQFGGMSPVESAILQMKDAGVVVAESIEWRR
jgi:nicotinamidase-related amidase